MNNHRYSFRLDKQFVFPGIHSFTLSGGRNDDTYHFTTPIEMVPGGRERQQSVFAGIKAAGKEETVLVHDGARPFIKREYIEQLVEKAKETGGPILNMFIPLFRF